MVTHFQAELVKKTSLTKNIVEFRFKPKNPIEFRAGEYMILKVGDLRRLYSISSDEEEREYFDLLIEVFPNGVGSQYLMNLSIGESADFMGPAGQFVAQKNGRDKIFLATGTGVAPIKSHVRALTKLQHSITLFWGLKTYEDIYYLDFLKEYAQNNPAFSFYICLTRQEDKSVFTNPYLKEGRVHEVMTRFLECEDRNLPDMYDYSVCGSRDMVSDITTYLTTKGVLKEHIFFEKF